MYKVFYQDRTIYITDDFSTHFNNNYGLFYKYYDPGELADLLKLFALITKIKKLYIFHNDLDHAFSGFKSCFEYIEASGGLVTNPEGKLLFIKRKGKWDLPKGKIEANETPELAGVREVAEETGTVDLERGDLIHETYHLYQQDQTFFLKKTYWFEMSGHSPQGLKPDLAEEITEAIWIDKTELAKVLANTYLSIIDLLQTRDLLPS